MREKQDNDLRSHLIRMIKAFKEDRNNSFEETASLGEERWNWRSGPGSLVSGRHAQSAGGL
jgi:hypothetical protein